MTEQPGLVNAEMDTWLKETLPKIEDASGESETRLNVI
jgi:hypothetical protein